MLKSVLKARQHSILHPERIVGKRKLCGCWKRRISPTTTEGRSSCPKKHVFPGSKTDHLSPMQIQEFAEVLL
jgi:hypothetical protein